MTKINKNCIYDQNDKNIVEIRKITWIGVITNLLLSIVKFILGIIGKSQAVVKRRS